MIVFGLLAIALGVVSSTSAATDKVFCYFTNWSVWREGDGAYDVKDIDPNLCTHILYAFVDVVWDGTINLSNKEYDQAAMKKLNDLKKSNKNLKTLISAGGWSAGSRDFSKIAAAAAKREAFAQNAIALMKKYGFDGFDVDWEYPGQRDGDKEKDKDDFVRLLRDLRENFDNTGKNYLLTIAVESSVDPSYNVKNIAKYVDFINVMTYDFHESGDGKTGQNSPLYASPKDGDKSQNVAASIEQWLSRGAPASKLVLGMGAYGRSFKLKNSDNHGLGAATNGAGKKGPYTDEAGYLGFNEICLQQKQGGWTTVFDNDQKVPYTYKGHQWVGYDNEKSIEYKVKYAKSQKLAGVMVWSIDTDDFKGKCGTKYALLNTIKNTL